MAAIDLVTLAEFKDYLAVTGSARDAVLRRAITRSSRDHEGVAGRRLVFRAPTEDDDAILQSENLAGTSMTLGVDGQPASGGRVAVVTVTDPDRVLTSGTLTITGTVDGVEGVSEAFDIGCGIGTFYGVKYFTAITQNRISDMVVGVGASIKIGTSLGYIEYHTPCGPLLRPMERPIQQVLALYEDYTRAYPASSLVDADDYLISRGRSAVIERLSDGQQTSWQAGQRAVKLVYSAGYAGAAAVQKYRAYLRERGKGLTDFLGRWDDF